MKNFCGLFLFVFVALLNISCQQKPTQALSTEPIFPTTDRSTEIRELFKKDPVIVDVRSAFDFGLSRVPQSVHLPWQDFTQKDSEGGRSLSTDYGAWVRRLATYGISPDKEVIVLGDESKEPGASARLAWTLSLVGVERVHPISIQSFRQLNLSQEGQIKNASLWLPKTKNDLYINYSEWLVLLGHRKLLNTATGTLLKERMFGKMNRWNLIQVDISLSSEVVFGWASVNNFKYLELFNLNGELDQGRAVNRLQTLDRSQDYLIVCPNGVKSAALAWSMGKLGFKNVVIVDGGIVR